MRFLKNYKINKIIWLLTASDIFTWSLAVVVGGFIGIYLSKRLGVDAVGIVGIGIAIATLTRALFQIPVGILSDKFKSTKDEAIMIIVGNLLLGIPFLFMPFVNSSTMYFILQAIFGLGTAINLTAWRKLFALNLDKNKEGLEYAVYDTTLSLATATFSLIAGVVANINDDYFNLVMIIIGVAMSTSWIWGVLILHYRTQPKNG